MRSYELGSTDPRQWKDLTDAEREAWHHPRPDSYHSFHVERMGTDVYRWRNSRTGNFCIGSFLDLQVALHSLQLRKVDPDYQQHATTLRVLSQEEVDNLLSDI